MSANVEQCFTGGLQNYGWCDSGFHFLQLSYLCRLCALRRCQGPPGHLHPWSCSPDRTGPRAPCLQTLPRQIVFLLLLSRPWLHPLLLLLLLQLLHYLHLPLPPPLPPHCHRPPLPHHLRTRKLRKRLVNYILSTYAAPGGEITNRPPPSSSSSSSSSSLLSSSLWSLLCLLKVVRSFW